MHFGIISPPVPGHLHPFGALGRELLERGHQVTLIHMEDVRAKAVAENLGFLPIGYQDHPPGSLPESLALLGRLDGFAALRFTVNAVRKTTQMFCRDAPGVIQNAKVDVLLVDQTEPAGCTIAEHLGIPFITICNALNLNEEPDIPPPFTCWRWCESPWARARNRLGYRVSAIVMAPVSRVIAHYRSEWRLTRQSYLDQSFSTLAQISQLPPGFDYPRKNLPPTFHYTGPLRKPQLITIPFPWERLNGRPLVYASLGTLQNGRDRVFQIFAEACSTLDVQLVLAGISAETARAFAGKPLAVAYAPQIQVLQKAALTLTHAGLNTVLDSLSCAVPMVAVPINYEQPAIAERVRWTGAGEVIPFSALEIGKLRQLISTVLNTASYKQSAVSSAKAVQSAGGVRRAADIIESVIAQ